MCAKTPSGHTWIWKRKRPIAPSDAPAGWADEILDALFAIAYGVQRDTHVRVDLLYSRLSDRQRQLINLAGHIVFLLPVGIFMLVATIPGCSALTVTPLPWIRRANS